MKFETGTSVPAEDSQDTTIEETEVNIDADVNKSEESFITALVIQTKCLTIDNHEVSDHVTTPGSRTNAKDKTVMVNKDTKDKAMELIDSELSLCGKQYHDIFTVNLSYQDVSCLQESMSEKLTNLVVLDLSHNKLCELPDFLNFKNLKDLDISHNAFESIPLCLQVYFSKLVKLNVSHNHIKTLHKPKCLPKLQSLFLNNNIDMRIPDWFWYQEFSCLTELNLSFTDPFFENLPIWLLYHIELKEKGVFSNLISLDMRNTGAVMSNIAQLKYLKNIKNLECSNDTSQVKGSQDLVNVFWELPNSLVHLSSVLELHISNVTLSLIPEDISNLVCLQILDISHNYLSKLPDSIGNLPSLQTLNMSYNKLSMLPDQFTMSPKLGTLHAEHNVLATLPQGFEALPLVYCDLYDNELGEECVPVLKQMSTLQSLDLMQNYFKQDLLPQNLQDNLRGTLPKSDYRSLEPKILEDFGAESDIEGEIEVSRSGLYSNVAYFSISSPSSSRSNSPMSISSDITHEPLAPCSEDNSDWDDETTNSDHFNFYLVDEWQKYLVKDWDEAIQKFRTREKATYFIPSDTQIKYFKKRNAVKKFDFLSRATVEGQFDSAE